MNSETDPKKAPDPRAVSGDSTLEIPSWLVHPYFVLPAILCLVAAVYTPTLNDWFFGDDLLLLRAARVVPFSSFLREAFDFTDFVPLNFYAYRPLYFIGFDVMYLAFGLSPAGYHVIVLAIHLANVLLTFHIARKLTGSVWIGYLTAAIFGLHPVYVGTVAWISGLNSLMATMCYLTATSALLAYDEGKAKGWLIAALVAYAVGLLFHQEIFLAPIVVLGFLRLRKPGWRRDLLSPASLLPFLAFGIVLVGFLLVQGRTSEEAGFADEFRPGVNTIWLALGTIAISVFPDNAMGFTAAHFGFAAVVLVMAGLSVVAATRHRPVLLFAIVWYASLVALPILFLDNYPRDVMQAAIGRKLYAAGPPLALILAISLAVAWHWLGRHPQVRAALTGVAVVAVLAFSFIGARERQRGLANEADVTLAFYQGLETTHPDLPDGGVLYVANAPFGLVLYCGGENATSTLCYVTNLAAVLYGRDVSVVLVTKERARELEAGAGLKPTDRVFCFRC